MLTLDRVLSQCWLAVLIVLEMKEHFSSAEPQQLELFPAVIMMMPELNALVSIYTRALYLHSNVNDTYIICFCYSSMSQW